MSEAKPFLNEQWRSIPSMPGYEASNLGRVRSWRGPNSSTRVVPRLRALIPNTRDGYLNVGFFDMQKRKLVLRKVHQLVLEAFRGSCPPGKEGRHRDGVKTNNRLSNLRWSTHLVNIRDQQRHGTHTRGERNGNAKLTSAIAKSIRVALADGVRGSVLAAQHDVSQATITRIKKGIRYVDR